MADDRRPSEEEIEELVGLTSRDRGSPAFVDLGDAYLALGRAREAVDVGAAGVAAAPDNMEGRVMLARAHAALHQWKEAQAELLKVVKVDRANKLGFALLGEVLLRRSDYERAIPVLQHAQNLDPANPSVLALLKRARSGQPLDPPSPVPVPVAPRRGAAPPPAAAFGNLGNQGPTKVEPRAAELARASAKAPEPPAAAARKKGPTRPPPAPRAPAPSQAYDDGPTSVAPDRIERSARPSAPPSFGITGEATALRGDPTEVSPPRSELFEDEATSLKDAGKVRMPLAAAHGIGDAPTVAAGSPAPVPSVRPRVIPAAKPVNAAAAPLRASAAVGEQYLNDLLTGGLLDVPGVRVPTADYDLGPGKRWGRSTRRAFILLFTIVILGTAGFTTWYYWAAAQRAAELAELRKASDDALATGSYDGLYTSGTKLHDALDLDKSDTLTFAEVAQTDALLHLLYAPPAPQLGDINIALNGAAADITKPDQPGYRELVIARAALALSGTSSSGANPTDVLVRTRKELEAWLGAGHDGDRWARWLLARVDLAQGHRTAAERGLRAAAGAPADKDRLVPAMIDLGDLLVDDGQIADGVALYDQALAIAKDHPLALLGKALAATDAQATANQAMTDYSPALSKDLGARVTAYRHLWLALAGHTLEDYKAAKEELDQARDSGITEPRFLARLALGYALEGDLANAAKARAAVTWYPPQPPDPKDPKAPKPPPVVPDTDPEVALADAAVELAAGLPQRALDTAKGDSLRARVLRGQAQLDLGHPKDAIDELDKAEQDAPKTVEIEIYDQLAHALASTGAERDAAIKELGHWAEKKTKLGRHAQGLALVAANNVKDGKERLEQALDGITDDQPNPVAYRTQVELAKLAMAQTPDPDLAGAAEHVDAALTANSGYLPAHILGAKVLLKEERPADAADLLESVVVEKELATPDVVLLHAEALATRPHVTTDDKGKTHDTTADDKKRATADLKQAKDAGAPPDEIGRIAALVDPGLPAELGVPAPAPPPPAPAPGAPPSPPKPPKRHGR